MKGGSRPCGPGDPTDPLSDPYAIEEVESTGGNAFVVWAMDADGNLLEHNPDMWSGQ